jgi:hypothetical protein
MGKLGGTRDEKEVQEHKSEKVRELGVRDGV